MAKMFRMKINTKKGLNIAWPSFGTLIFPQLQMEFLKEILIHRKLVKIT